MTVIHSLSPFPWLLLQPPPTLVSSRSALSTFLRLFTASVIHGRTSVWLLAPTHSSWVRWEEGRKNIFIPSWDQNFLSPEAIDRLTHPWLPSVLSLLGPHLAGLVAGSKSLDQIVSAASLSFSWQNEHFWSHPL